MRGSRRHGLRASIVLAALSSGLASFTGSSFFAAYVLYCVLPQFWVVVINALFLVNPVTRMMSSHTFGSNVPVPASTRSSGRHRLIRRFWAPCCSMCANVFDGYFSKVFCICKKRVNFKGTKCALPKWLCQRTFCCFISQEVLDNVKPVVGRIKMLQLFVFYCYFCFMKFIFFMNLY